MFTGLVEDVGAVVSVAPEGGGRRLSIRTSIMDIAEGDSVAVDGVCLTATGPLRGGVFQAVAGRETVSLTTLATWAPGREVNLERALQVGGRLGGHMVQGHVDGKGRIHGVRRQEETTVIWVEAPPALARYMAMKGSIAVDGVSLTLNEVQGARFRVNVIPHTLASTRLRAVTPGMEVNLEVDLLARYLERLLDSRGDQAGGLDMRTLRENGFL